VADYLVGRGVPFRRAHEIVGGLVRKLVAEQRDFPSLSMEEWRAASERFDADIRDRMTPAVSVSAKLTPQSTAPSAVRNRLAAVRKWLTGQGLC
jgi:argininosuccinate lyase